MVLALVWQVKALWALVPVVVTRLWWWARCRRGRGPGVRGQEEALCSRGAVHWVAGRWEGSLQPQGSWISANCRPRSGRDAQG